ncbi:MAG: hypothetical protein LQ348_004932 [Seirophora lacunosa]|nr:MAG: hypothetical protein LQ348_004932 [Seirophora lacunosa]
MRLATSVSLNPLSSPNAFHSRRLQLPPTAVVFLNLASSTHHANRCIKLQLATIRCQHGMTYLLGTSWAPVATKFVLRPCASLQIASTLPDWMLTLKQP